MCWMNGCRVRSPGKRGTKLLYATVTTMLSFGESVCLLVPTARRGPGARPGLRAVGLSCNRISEESGRYWLQDAAE